MTDELTNRWSQRFDVLEADGIDFVSWPQDPTQGEIYASYTKEDFLMLEDYNYPRSAYVFWKMVFGQKCYLVENKQK